LLVGEHEVESSAEIRARVTAARERQVARNQRSHGGVANAELRPAELEQHACLGEDEIRHLLGASSALGLTARSWHRVIRVARTIADLADDEHIGRAALSEALTYRILDRDEASRPRVHRPLKGGERRRPSEGQQEKRAEAQGGA
ncbi:MAG: hypothetical protein VX938_10745, partial [Myxococcota bacterium]|nr:hypothetical protein [Myxococcota bacterium]